MPFLSFREISLFVLGRMEIGLIVGRFYLQVEERLGFLISGRGEISQFNLGRGEIGTPNAEPVYYMIYNILQT